MANLIAYIHSFRGGLHGDKGELAVRDMEGMIQRVADDAARALGVRVRVSARLVIVPKQELRMVARGYPRTITFPQPLPD